MIPMGTAERFSLAGRRPSGGHGFTIPMPLRDAPPGRYVLHVNAVIDRGATSRTIPLQVE
jgi:hypothetical protein